MIDAMFSFEGRLERLPYFLRSVALWVVAMVGGAAVTAGAAILLRRPDRSGLAIFALCMLPFIAALLWCSLSLHVRRLRDIGWDPAVVIAGWFLFNIADGLVLPHLLPDLTHGRGTLVGTGVDTALALLILLWPGRDEAPGSSVPSRFAHGAPAAPPTSGGALQFGRRGLR